MTAQSTMEEIIRWAIDALGTPVDRWYVADRLKEALQAAPSREPDAREALADYICEEIGTENWPKLTKENWSVVVDALRQPDAPAAEKPIAMLGGIHGVCLIRHIENMKPDARKEYHTPLYRHPPFADRAQIREAFRAGWYVNAAVDDQDKNYLKGCEEVDWEEYAKCYLSSTDAPAAER